MHLFFVSQRAGWTKFYISFEPGNFLTSYYIPTRFNIRDSLQLLHGPLIFPFELSLITYLHRTRHTNSSTRLIKHSSVWIIATKSTDRRRPVASNGVTNCVRLSTNCVCLSTNCVRFITKCVWGLVRNVWGLVRTAWGSVRTAWGLLRNAWVLVRTAWGLEQTACGLVRTLWSLVWNVSGLVRTAWGVVRNVWGLVRTATFALKKLRTKRNEIKNWTA
jgi:hypothetical protein